jgi:RNA polymerase sigma factor (sigma-70 family)
MYALALRQLGGDIARAEETVQEAWVRAVERWAEFRDGSSRRTWLCGFVVRVAWEQLRSAAEMPAAADDDLARDDERLRGTFDRIDLERAIAALPPGFRQVLVLHDIEGYTHEEISSALGIVPGTSKSQLNRARQALRATLRPRGTHNVR